MQINLPSVNSAVCSDADKYQADAANSTVIGVNSASGRSIQPVNAEPKIKDSVEASGYSTDGSDAALFHKLKRLTLSNTTGAGGTKAAAESPEPSAMMEREGTDDGQSHPVITRALLEAMEIPVKSTLLQPYHPFSQSSHQSAIARPVHGVQHACRVAVWALTLLQLRRQQNDPAARALPDEMIPLLIKVCLFHDSGREADGENKPEWEKASGDNLAEHLRNCGMSQYLAWQCGEAVRYKDLPAACQHLPEAVRTLRSLLHDAGALDDMRVRPTFFMHRLESFNACQDEHSREAYRRLAKEVCQTIAHQKDLHYPITLQDSELSAKGFFSIAETTSSDEQRKQWEHHPHPLCHQLQEAGGKAGLVGELLTPFTRDLNHQSGSPFSLDQLDQLQRGSGTCQIGKTGLYKDAASQQRYYIKQTTSHDSACNQVLMANIAQLLGIKVPPTFIHQENGVSFVVSEWHDNLQGGEERLTNLPPEQWAKLLLINTIIGNEDITNSGWQNIELTSKGEPVMFDWDWAGLATRYQREGIQPDPKADDFSSMPVLLKSLRDPRAPAMNSHSLVVACKDELANLSDDLLGASLREILAGVNWQALDEQIEHSGFLPGDRTWLRQTLYDRIAWLSTRFPGSREAGEWLSPAEYRAIAAAGVRGGWLQVRRTDIPSGQVCVTQLLDEHSQPLTEMIVRLSRGACNRLSDNLAIERGLHLLNQQIHNFNNTPKDEYQDWRNDLTQLVNECEILATQLVGDMDRWDTDKHPEIRVIIDHLPAIADQGSISLASENPPALEKLPIIPKKLPEPAFPARVASKSTVNIEAKIQLAEYSHGFSRRTGESISYPGVPGAEDSKPGTSPVRAIELQPVYSEQGRILLYPENLPDARTFEHKLVFTLPGHGREVVDALFHELQGLGVEADRPDVDDLEARWLDALADYHGCLGDMNRVVAGDMSDEPVNNKRKAFLGRKLGLNEKQLDWEVHCRIRSGRLVFYRPGLPHGISQNAAQLYCPSHTPGYSGGEVGASKGVMDRILQNEGALSSFERRTDIGLRPGIGGLPIQDIYGNCGATFTRIQSIGQIASGDSGGVMSIQFKPEALGRLDTSIFPGKARVKSQYDALPARKPGKKIIPGSHADYQNLLNGDNRQETLFAMPLSMFDELQSLNIGSDEANQDLLYALKKRYSHWPDGRPIGQIFQHCSRSLLYEVLSSKSTVCEGIRNIIDSIFKRDGDQGFAKFVTDNPQFQKGRLNNLNGHSFSHMSLKGVDFRNCSMKDTHFKRVKFDSCQFTTEQINHLNTEELQFINCSYEGESFSKSVLRKTALFCNQSNWTNEQRERFSAKLYQSCFQPLPHREEDEGAGIFDLKLWLDIMQKNQFLHSSPEVPLDATTVNIMGEHIDEIKNHYAKLLPLIVKSIIDIEFSSVSEALVFVKNNPKFYQHKIDDLGCFLQERLIIKGLDLRSSQIPDLHGKLVIFDSCQFTTEQINTMNIDEVKFVNCSFQGEYFSKWVLKNGVFFSEGFNKVNTWSPEGAEQFSAILYRSCIKSPPHNEGIDPFDLNLWLDLMIKNKFLHSKPEAPLDSTTIKILRKYIHVLKEGCYVSLLPEIIKGILGIEFSNDHSALAFVNNNPQFYQHKIDDLGGLPYRSDDKNNEKYLKKIVSQRTLDAWLTDFPDYTLCADYHNVFREKAKGLRKHKPHLYKIHARKIVDKLRGLTSEVSLFSCFVYDALVYLAKERLLDEEGQSYWLDRFAESYTMRASCIDPEGCHLEEFRVCFHEFWQSCQPEILKLTAAKNALQSKNIMLSHLTVVEFYKLIIDNGEGKTYLGEFVDYINALNDSPYLRETSCFSENSIWNSNFLIDIKKALIEFEIWLKENNQLLLPFWQKEFTDKIKKPLDSRISSQPLSDRELGGDDTHFLAQVCFDLLLTNRSFQI